MTDNKKIINSVDYKIIDASPELARADINLPSSGCDMSELLTENTRCGGRCKKKS